MDKMKEDVRVEVEKALFKMHKELESDKVYVIDEMKKRIIFILDSISESQKAEVLGRIATIAFVLSRVELLNEKYKYPVFIYGKQMYKDEMSPEFEIDVRFFYKYLDELKKSLNNSIKKYISFQYSMPVVEKELNSYFVFFNMYVVNILREVFCDEQIKAKIEAIDKEDYFVIIQNEIYEKPYLLYEYVKEGAPNEIL